MLQLNRELKKFEQACTEEYERLEIKSDKKIMYHYTSTGTLSKILKARKLHFTRSTDLNDPDEILGGTKVLKNILMKHKLPEKLKSDLISFSENYFKKLNIYICSFSKNSKSLPMWRWYGDHGFGVAIGFTTNIPMENEANISPTENPYVLEVEYGEKKFENRVNKLIKKLTKFLKKIDVATYSEKEIIQIYNSLSSSLAMPIIITSILTKHIGYQNEEEVRLILMDGEFAHLSKSPGGFYFPDNERIIRSTDHIKKFNYEKEDKFDTSRSEFSIKRIESLPFSPMAIQEIILGPQHNFKKSKLIIENILTKNNLSLERIKIKKSDFPYLNIETKGDSSP